MRPGTELDLVDRIYEAAFVPELWPGVLHTLAERSGSAAGSFIVFGDDLRATKYAATDLIRPVMDDISAADEWQSTDAIRVLFLMRPTFKFIYDADYYSREVMDSYDPRTSRTRPLGLGGQVGYFLVTPNREVAVFAMERWLDNDRPSKEELEGLDAVRPHLARAAVVSARLELEHARATAHALQAIGLPAAVLSRTGRVRATNPLFDAMNSVFVATAYGGMAIVDPAANALFRVAVEATTANVEPLVRSIPVKANGDVPPLVIHLLPLRRSAHDIFSGSDILVAATAVGANNATPSPTILTALFDLTPSEARLAVALTQGRSLKAIVADSGITTGTARKYLEIICHKTGTHSQAQLVALLKGARPLGLPG
jgi:DNA-binding CsgD family transcriptional regulator